MDLLLLLVEQRGQLVTREQIIERIWGKAVFLDTDSSINAAIRKIRHVLKDDPERPQYVQTVSGRGYRFILPIIEATPVAGGGNVAPIQTPSLENLIGRKVSHYRVLQVVGGGGMGVVYKAEDLKLGRQVAIKFLPAEMASDPKAFKRLEREARAASALEHPNICPIYELGAHDGQPFIVMPLLEGQTLRERIESAGQQKKVFPTKEFVDLALQIITGLEAAHEKGIIHRDIKPANIFITNRGEAKVLDFGLAEMIEPSLDQGAQEQTVPTETVAAQPSKFASNQRLTVTGMTMGTAYYMSPEQVRGEKLDARTDLFSFGLVLYEMATGERAFPGNTAAVVHDAILHRSPLPILQLKPELPTGLEPIIARALEKDRSPRYQSAADMRTDLQRLKPESESAYRSKVPRRGYRFVAPVNEVTGSVLATTDETGKGVKSASAIHKTPVIAVIGIILVVLGGLSAFWLRSPVAPPRVLKYTQLTSDGRYKDALFMDGSRLYFTMAKSGRLTLAQMSTAGGQINPVSVPFELVGLSDISPDGSSLLVQAYAADQSVDDSATYVLPLPAGTPRRLGGGAFSEATWSPDGRRIAYREGTDLYVAESDGSAPRKLATLQGPPLSPRWSPDGKLLRFFVWIGLGNHALWEVHSDGSGLRQLFPGWNNPPTECCGTWTPDGRYFIFMSSRGNAPKGESATNLWAVREKDKYFRRVSHKPVQLTLTSTGTAQIVSAVPSRDGKRLFVITGNERYELVRYDKGSRNFLPYLPGVNGVKFSFSRDGLWVVYVNLADNTLWRSRVDGSERLQLTFPPMNANFIPSWSPDGSQIAFPASLPGRPVQIFRISRDGGSPEQLTEGKHRDGDIRPSWSPDGKTLVFGEYPGEFFDSPKISPMHVWLLDLQSRKLTTLPGSADLFRPTWSPDGRYISAYSTGGSLSVFDFATQEWTEIVKPPNEWCAWSHDGKYIQCGSMVKGEEVLQRVRVSDHKVEMVTSLKNLGRVGFNDIKTWLGVAPDDSPLAVRDVSSFDIYALDWELP